LRPRIFISFAWEDEDARGLLGAELARQGIESYDYSFPHQGSQVGMNLSGQLAQEIARAELFIALVTDRSSSPEKHVIHAEIQQALDADLMQRGRLLVVLLRTQRKEPDGTLVSRAPKSYACLSESRLQDIAASYPDHLRWSRVAGHGQFDAAYVQIRSGEPGEEISLTAYIYRGFFYFPVTEWERLVVANAPILEFLRTLVTPRWLGPFSVLKEHVCTHVDEIEPRNFAAVGQLVCERLGLSYERPAPHDSRLPFYQRLQEELWRLPTNVRVQVLGHLNCFQSNIVVGSWLTVLDHIRVLQTLLLQRNYEAYYPRIIEGLCLARLGEHAKALAVFERCRNHPDADENALGAQAKVLYKLGRYAEALAALREAIEWCDRKGDSAPVARLDRLTMALESGEHGGEPGPDYDREYTLTLKDAETLLRQDFSTLLLEERIKVAKLRARWLRARARFAGKEAAHDLRTASLQVFDEIVQSVHAKVVIPPASVREVPSRLDNAFYVLLADVGFFLDEPALDETGERVRLVGTRDDFWLVERQQAYRFSPSSDGTHAIRYVDLDTVLARHQLRLENGHQRSRLMGELEQALVLFPTTGLVRFVMREWCELDELERARRIGQSALVTCGDDAFLMQDLAEITELLGNHADARRLMEASAEVARQALLSSLKNQWSQQELLLAWGRARGFAGDIGDVMAAAKLSGLPVPTFGFNSS
jgi:tetratricopeptide (TPR) repeat protein